jgi:hypothetical protein
MTQKLQAAYDLSRAAERYAGLDIVVPVTTPVLTRAAVQAASQLAAGLDSDIRLLKVQVVPFPRELDQSPVSLDFLERQLKCYGPGIETKNEVFLAREFEAGLAAALNEDSLVLLAAPRRPWRTRNERLAAHLRRAGYIVLLVSSNGRKDNA